MSIVFTLPLAYAAFCFLMWLRNRGNSAARGKLPGAVALLVLSRVIMAIFVLFTLFLGGDFGDILKFLIIYGIEFLLFAYYYAVVRRFAGK